jgi:hypothetical protein
MKHIVRSMMILVFLFGPIAMTFTYAQTSIPTARVVSRDIHTGKIVTRTAFMPADRAIQNAEIYADTVPDQHYWLEAPKNFVRTLFHLPAKRFEIEKMERRDLKEINKAEEAH